MATSDDEQHGPKWSEKARRLIVPVISSFLCFIFVVIPRLNKLGGYYAFLTPTALFLFFFPTGGFLNQLEVTALGIIGGTLGLAFACATLAIAAYCGDRYGSDSNQARAVIATGLAVLSFACGFARSYSPRLTAASRLALFFPIFLLTASTGLTSLRSFYFTDQFLVTLFAAIFSLVPTLLFAFRSSSKQLGRLVLQSLESSSELLPIAFSIIVDDDDDDDDDDQDISSPHTSIPGGDLEQIPPTESVTAKAKARQNILVKRLRSNVRGLKPTYHGYTHELSRSRIVPASIRPLISSLHKLHRNPLLGPSSHVPGERIQSAIQRTFAPLSMPPSVPGTPRASRSSGFLHHRMGHHSPQSPDSDHFGSPQHPPSSPKSQGMSPSVSLPFSLRINIQSTHRSSSRHHRSASAISSSPLRPQLLKACDDLIAAITTALTVAGREMGALCGWRRPVAPAGESPKSKPDDSKILVLKAKSDLELALTELQAKLTYMLDRVNGKMDNGSPSQTDSADLSPPISPIQRNFSTRSLGAEYQDHGFSDRDHFRMAFYMTALLDCAKDVLDLLFVVINILGQAEEKAKWHFPLFTWPWLAGRQSGQGESRRNFEVPNGYDGEVNGKCDDDVNDQDDDNHIDSMDFVTATLHRERPPDTIHRSMMARASQVWLRMWNHRNVLRARVGASHILHSTRHSSHVLFGLKMAFGVICLSIPAFLEPDSHARGFYAKYRGSWIPVSYMFVLEVHTGATFKVGFMRLVGTFVGAVTAYVLDKIVKNEPWAMVALCTVCAVPLSYGILFTSYPQLPTVAAITLPPLVYLHYLGLDEDQSSFDLAYTRFVDITIGIVAAFLVGTLIWPNHARVRYFLAVSKTLDHVTEYFLRMSRDNLRPSLVYHANSKQYDVLESNVRSHIRGGRTLIDIQRKEVSLLPRPVRLYSEVVDCTERLIELLTEIRVLRFSVPRKATVLDVMTLRRELVSSILINLWAISQSFRSRSPLPQYLPSPRVALQGIMETVDEYARSVRHRAKASTTTIEGMRQSQGQREELAILYGMAENEALGELCNTLEELVAAAQTLFGTRSFVDIVDQGIPMDYTNT